MKVKDLLTVKGSWDVYENIADEIGIAFDSEGVNPLTDEGMKKFRTALNFEILRIDKDMIVINTEKYFKDKKINIEKYDFESRKGIPKQVLNLIDFFWYYAGYCSQSDYDKYFKAL